MAEGLQVQLCESIFVRDWIEFTSAMKSTITFILATGMQRHRLLGKFYKTSTASNITKADKMNNQSIKKFEREKEKNMEMTIYENLTTTLLRFRLFHP